MSWANLDRRHLLPVPGRPYLAVTCTVQRLIMQARAQRLPAGDGHAGSLTSHGY